MKLYYSRHTEARKANIDFVDVMSLDVEGHELQVLKDIDWEKLKIKVILVEVENESKDEIRDFLALLASCSVKPKRNQKGR